MLRLHSDPYPSALLYTAFLVQGYKEEWEDGIEAVCICRVDGWMEGKKERRKERREGGRMLDRIYMNGRKERRKEGRMDR